MTATKTLPRRKPATKTSVPPARPVSAVLLELVYLMHVTKVVGHRETPAARRTSGRSI
jgi:hypothetical protein